MDFERLPPGPADTSSTLIFVNETDEDGKSAAYQTNLGGTPTHSSCKFETSDTGHREALFRPQPSRSSSKSDFSPHPQGTSPSPSQPRVAKEQWELWKPTIERLYIHEGRTFDKVAEYLKTHHGFCPTRKQFSRRILNWGFAKNAKRDKRPAIMGNLDGESQMEEFESKFFQDHKVKKEKIEDSKMMTEPGCGESGLMAALPENILINMNTSEPHNGTFKKVGSSCGGSEVAAAHKEIMLVDTDIPAIRTQNLEEPGHGCNDPELTATPQESFLLHTETTKKRTRDSKKISGSYPSFACPYAKKSPLKYRSCHAYILKRIRDVKQHLSRCHQLPTHCPRCRSHFDDEEERDEHIRASFCEIQHIPNFEGVTRAQKQLLTQRFSPKITEVDQWISIFDILFPGESRPRSVHINVDLTVELEAFQDLMYAEGASIISDAIRSKGICAAPMADEGRELYALLQCAIEEGFQRINELWSTNLLPDPTSSRNAAAGRLNRSTSLQGSQALEMIDPSLLWPDNHFWSSLDVNMGIQEEHRAASHDHHQGGGDQAAAICSVQGLPSEQGSIAETYQCDNSQLNSFSSEACNTNHGYWNPEFDTSLGEGNDIWSIDQRCMAPTSDTEMGNTSQTWDIVDQNAFYELSTYGLPEEPDPRIQLEGTEFYTRFHEDADLQHDDAQE